jgi:hypothetical protein
MSRDVLLHEPPQRRRNPAAMSAAARWCVRGLLAAWLLASMLFAHGCHGDEDHELFTACVEWIADF